MISARDSKQEDITIDQIDEEIKKQKLNSRFGSRFCKLIQKVLTEKKDLFHQITSRTNYSDEIKHIQEACHNLIDAYAKLLPASSKEELNRTEEKIPASMREEIQNLNAETRSLKNQIDTITTEYAAKENMLKKQLPLLSEEIDRNASDLQLYEVTEIKEEAGLYDARRVLDTEFKSKELLYQSKCDCCGCIPSRVAKEKKEMDDAKANLDAADQKIKIFNEKKFNNPIKTKLECAKQKEATTKLELDTLIKNPTSVTTQPLVTKFDEAKTKLAKAELNKRKTEIPQETIISLDNMVLYFRTYVCFIDLEEAAESASAFDSTHAELADYLRTYRLKLDIPMENLWCQDTANRTGKIILDEIFLNRKKMTDREAKDFRDGKITERLKTKIATPPATVSQLSHFTPIIPAIIVNEVPTNTLTTTRR